MHEARYVDYLEHIVPLPKMDIIICPFLDYYILSIFHNLGSPLNYHTLIFDVMSSRNMYLYNAYIYTYILFMKRAYIFIPFYSLHFGSIVIRVGWAGLKRCSRNMYLYNAYIYTYILLKCHLLPSEAQWSRVCLNIDTLDGRSSQCTKCKSQTQVMNGVQAAKIRRTGWGASRCSEGALLRRFIVPKVRWYEGSLVRIVYLSFMHVCC